MSATTILYDRNKVKPVPPDDIPEQWRHLLAMECLAPVVLRGGIARARTRLLQNVPNYMIPQFLDSLAAGGATV